MKLSVKAAALTLGTLWGITLFGLTWWLILRGGADDFEAMISHFYLGYRVSPVGSLIGLAWALPDGFIVGAILAWVYNFFVGRATTATES